MTLIQLVNVVLFVVGTVAAVVSPPCYHVWTRGAWRRTREGRHLMAYMTVLAVALGLTAFAAFVAAPWLIYVAPFVYAALAFVLWQRLWLIWLNQHPKERG